MHHAYAWMGLAKSAVGPTASISVRITELAGGS